MVTEDGMNKEGYNDSKGKMTIMENFKQYTIKEAIFNWAEVPLATLKNAWCKLLKTPKTPMLRNDKF